MDLDSPFLEAIWSGLGRWIRRTEAAWMVEAEGCRACQARRGIADGAEAEQVSSRVPCRCRRLLSPYSSPVSRGKVEQEMKYLPWQAERWRKPASPSCIGMRGREEEVRSGTCKPWALVDHRNSRVAPLRSSHSCEIISFAIFTFLYLKKKMNKLIL